MYSTTPFEYVRASSWEDAVARLQAGDEDARVIAGGQSLVPMMMLRLAAPPLLVDVADAAARSIETHDGVLRLSALVRHVDLERSDAVRSACPMLAEAAGHIGNVRVRQRGTIGGSMAHGESTAELATSAVAHQARVHVLGPNGPREIDAHELFLTHLITSLAPGEVVTSVEFPLPGARTGSSFQEIARRAGDFAMVEAAALVTLDEDGRCAAARLVIGAVSDRPTDVSSDAQALVGAEVTDQAITELARSVAAGVQIGASSHAGVEYRRELVAVLARRALRAAAARAAGHADDSGDPPTTNGHRS